MLRIENLRAGYKGSDALHSVSIRVRRGTIVSVVGANGAGKSTLINTISRLVSANSGSILFEDRNITTLKPADAVEQGIVQVPEGRQLFTPLTVDENLRLGFHRLAGRPDSASLYRQRLDYVLSLFPILKERASQRSGTMSGGEQQMLAIGRALMADPKLLLLDEPSLGLAPMVVDRIFEILATLRKDGLTILLVEQHADEALQLADYGYVMAVGRVRAEGPGNALRGDPALQHSYLGRPSEMRAAG
ncbi:ABC transporter ATP-binding protein [Azospirillum agricola]|uniref:ABC transporter ATP-binding protein n=1 Tax=Azospirillum agricola TaxID=1720247 RepID=UPI000A0F0DD1|nr:ABC transporter ATP-binding protein [Azospirillum agricola]SMH38850.1 amino acid/amide ABC transporter ATP-binding protein 2, HAAT family [Azospirillum lipoferum]